MDTALSLKLQGCVSVIIPALNESARIDSVVRYALEDTATAEVIVIDDSSIDDTRALATAAGARVLTSSMLGKGASMRDGVLAASKDVLVFLDGDLSGLRPGIVSDLARCVVANTADFVKGQFGRSGGRVTELTAKPMLKVFFPELAELGQPLGGLIAARRSLLNTLTFEDGYGVDIGLLIDAHRAGARIAEVDIGSLEHDSQPLLDLTLMATEIARVIYQRARVEGRLHAEQIISMYETQRHAAATLDYSLMRRRGRTRVVLVDMDTAVTSEPLLLCLARATGNEQGFTEIQETRFENPADRIRRNAALFRFVHKKQFERMAHDLPLRSGAVEWVNHMRRAGFMVGLVSSAWFVIAEIVRRRLFADFAVSHLLHFEADVCNGAVSFSRAFTPIVNDEEAELCSRHVVEHIRADTTHPRVEEVWAVGGVGTLEYSPRFLHAADCSYVVGPGAPGRFIGCSVELVASYEALVDRMREPTPWTP